MKRFLLDTRARQFVLFFVLYGHQTDSPSVTSFAKSLFKLTLSTPVYFLSIFIHLLCLQCSFSEPFFFLHIPDALVFVNFDHMIREFCSFAISITSNGSITKAVYIGGSFPDLYWFQSTPWLRTRFFPPIHPFLRITVWLGCFSRGAYFVN